jgi:hypothetical protein
VIAVTHVARLEVTSSFRLWVVGDVHGRPDLARQGLASAGLIDDQCHWIGGMGVCVVFAGDLIDRGPCSLSAITLVDRLSREASVVGSMVAAVGGNHEAILVSAVRGNRWDAYAWLMSGGAALCREVGLEVPDGDPSPGLAVDLAAEVAERAPDLVTFCRHLPGWARWRDVAVVHAGIPDTADPTHDLDRGVGRIDASIRIRAGLDEAGFPALQRSGIRRAVVGHVPTPGRAVVLAGGSVLSLDANSGRTRPDAVTALALAEVPSAGPFDAEAAIVVTAPALDAAPCR